MISSASANASMASCSRPPTWAAYSRTALLISISTLPPPATILGVSVTSLTTYRASLSALSASSIIRSRPALTKMATALGSLHSSTKIILSLPTFFSSTTPHDPRSLSCRSARLFTTLPPVALASFSMSLFLTRRAESTPALARKCWAMSSMPFWQNSTLAPEATTSSTFFFSISLSWSRNALMLSGLLIRISASNSVFFTSRGVSRSAIFASVTFLGIPACTTSLSMMMPLTSCVSSRLWPSFLTIWTLSTSAMTVPSRFSTTCLTASMTMPLKWSRTDDTALLLMLVLLSFMRISRSSKSTSLETLSSVSRAFSAAFW